MRQTVRMTRFNTRPADELTRALLSCCDVPHWAATIRDGRPYSSVEALLDTADAAACSFTRADLDRALAAHPRIGERAQAAGSAAAWSRREQAAVRRDEQTLAALADANRAYEDRFDRVFLVCASGLGSEQILTALRDRLGNDDETEARVVADELRKIALLRLREVVLTEEAIG
ncbi:MAG TPA: 2-oxo-4-hydroxy-4-carboxy-5-ureidoimidazoline decarboxylase [Nocardioidaceae bacterium]|nr:2-oxo-4-hydroxy-4-carboxy-5-ureidoimidazoline decarboxylase [Nocardioidaceae bacterium]